MFKLFDIKMVAVFGLLICVFLLGGMLYAVNSNSDYYYKSKCACIAKLDILKVKMGENPPNSRHFYNCKPASKEGSWNLTLYSNTTNEMVTWQCSDWRGHTSPQYLLPKEKQKKLTCKDERGLSYPYEP